MKTWRTGIWWVFGWLLLTAGAGWSQTEPEPVPAGEIFTRVLADEGLDAAVDSLRTVLADTTGAYGIDGQELVMALPRSLVRDGRRDAAVALLETLEVLFGDHPVYWRELGKAYLQLEQREEAEAALTRCLEIHPEQPEIGWMLAHLDQLIATIRVQFAAEGRYEPGENTGLQGPYLGQTPPGATPEVFAPGLLSTLDHEYSITFAPDGREIYFSRSDMGTLVCRWEEAGWTAPRSVALIDADHLTEEAGVAPDGERIFFCARPRDMRGEREIWVAERVGDGWGEACHLFTGMYPNATLDGTLYYTEITGQPDYGVLVRRRLVDGDYGEPEELVGGGVNSAAPDAHPYITPDENLLIFDSMRETAPGLYASRRNEDGTWREAVPLSDLLGIPPVGQGALAPDGRYLFFCLAGDMYWVDAGLLKDLW